MTPAPLRIGVTGHRRLPADPALPTRVAEVVRTLAANHDDGHAPPRLVVVSALAEGADRLVAETVLRVAGATLEVVLPVEPAIYEQDFTQPGSSAAFHALLARAVSVKVVPPGESRRHNFEAAGLAMLERSDLVIALWDGQPARGRGGTAEMVERAIARGLPVLWIGTSPPFALQRLERQPSVPVVEASTL